MTILLRDDFRGDRRPGRALGRAVADDPARGGVDRERVLSVDDGALRIAPLLQAGWGRAELAYGPFPNEPGLAFAVLLLNGHNTSQAETMADTLRSRLARWARGSGSEPAGRRLRAWLRGGRPARTWRQVRLWRRLAVGSSRVTPLDENLAVGFSAAAAGDPPREATGFVMHAGGPVNGVLWAGAAGRWAPVVNGVQNVPIRYLAVVRGNDVLLGASSLPGARGFAAEPGFRPLALVPRPSSPSLHAIVQQAVLGQIGFRADTRVHAARVARLDPAAASALAPLDALAAGHDDGAWRRCAPARPAGLLRCGLAPAALGPAGVTIGWRLGAGDHLELALTPAGAALTRVAARDRRSLAAATWAAAPADVQVLDDGREVTVLADGRRLFDDGCAAPAGGSADAGADGGRPEVGVALVDGGLPPGLAALEIWPRELPLPDELRAGAPWQPEAGAVVVAADPLLGPAGDLAGRALPVGGGTWQRLHGDGRLELAAEGGARWLAGPERPLPGRTIYALDWPDPGFADLEVTLIPPGTARGQREHGTAGFCLWQDRDHHLLVNTWLDDGYGGASLSSFPTIGGFEDIYDAIWTNVGDRVTWGRPVRLRLVCDGLRYTVSLDGEPVLHRSLADIYPGCRPLRLTKVGLLGNWEWGADTGSRFRDFRAAARPGRG